MPSPFRRIGPRLAFLILLAMTALIGLLIYQQVQKHNSDEKHADEGLQRLAVFAAHAERERFDAAQRLLVLASQSQTFRTIAADPTSQESFDSCTKTLFVLDQLLPETSGFSLWDTNGSVLCSSHAAKTGEFSVADRLWFQTAKSQGKAATGSYELAPPANTPSLGFGLPIKDAAGQRVVAYLSTGLRLDKTDELLAGTNLPHTGRISIIDQNGIIIGSTDGRTGVTAPGFIDRAKLLGTFLATTVGDTSSGRRIAAVRITDAKDAEVSVVIGADKSALVPPLMQTLVTDLWPVVLVTLMTLLAVWLLAHRWVVRPVSALVAASDALGAGKLDARATVPGGVIEFEKLGASFNEMAERRELASEAKDEFLGLISHELRTPITIVLGNAEILQRHGDKLHAEVRHNALDDIHGSAERLAAIIDNLMALARLDRGAELELEPLAVTRVARASASAHERLTARRVQVHGDDNLLAMGGEEYVEQVLQNLMSNAMKYGAADDPVEVFIGREDELVVVRVYDRGEGVEESEREAVFEPFYRSARTSASTTGVGIGLSVCKRLIEAMGGSIWCENRSGGGCEFGFSLPVASLLSAVTPDEEAVEVPTPSRSASTTAST